MSNRLRLVPSIAVAGVAVLSFAACGNQQNAGTTTAGDNTSTSGATTAPPVVSADQQLVVGTLLPQTGSLAYLGPPEIAGVDMAVAEINAAGGVLGKPVKVEHADSGDRASNIAGQSVDRLFSQKADVVVGAASSSVSLAVLEQVTKAGKLMISPANTSNELTTANDSGLYFRTAPPDTLQGQVLAQEIIGDGNETLAIMALQDAYGTGLADRVEEVYKQGGGEVVEKIIYDPKAPNFNTEVARVKAKNPEAILLIGFDESAKVILEMETQGIGPRKKPLYLTDGNLSNKYKESLPAGVLDKAQGTQPGAQASDQFKADLKKVKPDLADFSYAAESYDATMLVALAAIAAKSDDGKAIAAKMQEVSAGGEVCKEFAACKALLDQGKDVDYNGVSGPIEFDANGDPTQATIGIYNYGPDNTYKFDKAIERKMS